jgi:hypothetical protein
MAMLLTGSPELTIARRFIFAGCWARTNDAPSQSTETARRFYRSNGYVEDGLPVGNFGTSSGYPMSKLVAS